MVIPRTEVVITVATPSRRELTRDFQVKGVGEKIVEVHQGEDTLIRCEGIVEEADQGIDQKDTKKGPDPDIAEQAADLDLSPDTGLADSKG